MTSETPYRVAPKPKHVIILGRAGIFVMLSEVIKYSKVYKLDELSVVVLDFYDSIYDLHTKVIGQGETVVRYNAVIDEILCIDIVKRESFSDFDDFLNTTTLLHLAVQKMDYVLVKYLSKRMNPNLPNNSIDRLTPLHMAVLNKDISCIKILLESPQINVNCVDVDSTTPLIFAAIENNVKAVRALLQYENSETPINVLIDDSLGSNALICSAINGNIKIAKELLQHSSYQSVLANFVECELIYEHLEDYTDNAEYLNVAYSLLFGGITRKYGEMTCLYVIMFAWISFIMLAAVSILINFNA